MSRLKNAVAIRAPYHGAASRPTRFRHAPGSKRRSPRARVAARRARKRSRDTARAPRRAMCGVSTWMSSQSSPRRSQVLDQVEQRELRGMRLAEEHALRREGAVHVDAVDGAHEPTRVPGLRAVRAPQCVQALVGIDDFRRDPRAVLPRARRVGAGPDDGGEVGVEREPEGTALADPGQAARHMEVREVEHAPLGRREPQHGQARGGPREDALAVGLPQGLGVQVAADGDQPVTRGRARIGESADGHRRRAGASREVGRRDPLEPVAVR